MGMTGTERLPILLTPPLLPAAPQPPTKSAPPPDPQATALQAASVATVLESIPSPSPGYRVFCPATARRHNIRRKETVIAKEK